MTAPGRLFGVGVGPGDPELVTVKGQRIIGACGVVAYPEKRPGSSIARRAAAPWIAAGCEELALVYPVTTGETDHPEGYEGALRDFYDDSAAQIAAELDAGRDVAVLCEGDPSSTAPTCTCTSAWPVAMRPGRAGRDRVQRRRRGGRHAAGQARRRARRRPRDAARPTCSPSTCAAPTRPSS